MRTLDKYIKNNYILSLTQENSIYSCIPVYYCILEDKVNGTKDILSTHYDRQSAQTALQSYKEDYL